MEADKRIHGPMRKGSTLAFACPPRAVQIAERRIMALMLASEPEASPAQDEADPDDKRKDSRAKLNGHWI